MIGYLVAAIALWVFKDDLQSFFFPRSKSIKSGSKGEESISEWLTSRGIRFQREHVVHISGTDYRFDFYIPSEGVYIEFDGEQHFTYKKHFHKNAVGFQESQLRDRIKSNWVLQQDKRLIRICYDDDISHHLEIALLTKSKLYLSNPDRYKYILADILPPRRA